MKKANYTWLLVTAAFNLIFCSGLSIFLSKETNGLSFLALIPGFVTYLSLWKFDTKHAKRII